MVAEHIVVGTAGWSIPRQCADEFGAGCSALERYATRFTGAEINTTFYRSHRPDTYRRWAGSVPDSFCFSVKVPNIISHQRGLVDADTAFARFIDEVSALGDKLGPILLQLPPKLQFDATIVGPFFRSARRYWDGEIVVEPRHGSWFVPDAETLLTSLSISRVGADPVRGPGGLLPGGSASTCYLRLHGSPRVYFSSYDDAMLGTAGDILAASPATSRWCIFDNTASGAAAADALRLQRLLTQ